MLRTRAIEERKERWRLVNKNLVRKSTVLLSDDEDGEIEKAEWCPPGAASMYDWP